MEAITLRNLPPELVRVIQRRARQKGLSLNKAVINLLEESVGTRKRTKGESAYHDLDDLAGRWTRAEAAAFETTLSKQRRIDEALWE